MYAEPPPAPGRGERVPNCLKAAARRQGNGGDEDDGVSSRRRKVDKFTRLQKQIVEELNDSFEAELYEKDENEQF